MNLTHLKDFFLFAGQIERDLINFRTKFPPNINIYSLYLTMFAKPAPSLTFDVLNSFMKSFNYEVSQFQLNSLNANANYKFITTEPPLSKQQILEKGIRLLITEWGNGNQIGFHEFSLMVKGQQCLETRGKEVQFKNKKVLFDLLNKQIQNLLNLSAFKKSLSLQYKNIQDLFEMITNKQTFDNQCLQNLFLMFHQRKQDHEIQQIATRLNMPMTFNTFFQIFKQQINNTKHKEFKVFHTSAKKIVKYESEQKSDKFHTPVSQKRQGYPQSTAAEHKYSSKIQRLRDNVEISQFNLKSPTTSYPNVELLSKILLIEEQFQDKKINLVFQKDCDLQLVYERYGDLFEKILNKCYGMCNFSAFVRFLVPSQFQFRYLSFIRYNKDNKFTEATTVEINNLIEQYYLKQSQIDRIWQNIDKALTFRGFCLPKDSSIPVSELNKYFTKRQTNLLLDRMDPHKTGYIEMDNFR